jgi:signal transduction histidine kinase
LRLPDFIQFEIEAILLEWETFAAAQLPAAAEMKSLALRDRAKQILQVIARDIRRPLTEEAQTLKSMGRAPLLPDTSETAAETHALLRARSGFDIIQLAAEYRALRASVLRLWKDAGGVSSDEDFNDMLRFNEGIDQALTESISSFSVEIEGERNLLLGMIGHDMRNPLQAIRMTASYLQKLNAGEHVAAAAERLVFSGARLKAMLGDLSDFSRDKLGLGIEVSPHPIDLADVFLEEVQQLRTAHPTRRIDLSSAGELGGVWDAGRMHQVLGNLLSNALKYGKPGSTVEVVLAGMGDEVIFTVANHGVKIDDDALRAFFDPLSRGQHPQAHRDQDGGLGGGEPGGGEVLDELAQALPLGLQVGLGLGGGGVDRRGRGAVGRPLHREPAR